jgi:hemolysin activation/secretion protein
MALAGPPASAQPTPDAGSLIQQIEQNKAPALPPRGEGARRPSVPQPAATPSSTQVDVKRFALQGNTLLDDEHLQTLLAPYRDRSLGLAELQQAAFDIGEAYAQAGWLARAYLPRQDVSDGVVKLQIVEARFGQILIEGAAQRFSGERAAAMIRKDLPAGAPLNLNTLDRALMLVDDLPGLSASGSLSAGEREGETDLALKLADTAQWSGQVGVDNHGGRATGTLRSNALLALNSPLRRGDAWNGVFSHTRGSDYASLGATVPVGLRGWRVGASASSLRYHLVGDDFQALQARGDSRTAGLQASLPLLRSRTRNLVLQLNADRKDFDNQANGATTSRYQASTLSLGLSGNAFDGVGGGGANAGLLNLTSGRLDLDGSPHRAADAQTAQTHGAFSKLRFAASRQQAVTPQVSAYAGLSGQLASKNLDSSEKFYLGGPQGVRAYPASEAGGSAGQLLNLELRGQLSHGLRATLFYDHGHVQVHKHGGFVGAPQPNAYSLKGAGLGLGWTGPGGIDLAASVARRIGDNPAAGPGGQDQDGSHRKTRGWLQGSVPF